MISGYFSKVLRISVRMKPGAIPLTRILCGAQFVAMPCARWVTPALATQYGTFHSESDTVSNDCPRVPMRALLTRMLTLPTCR